MKQNLFVVSSNYAYTKDIAVQLAEVFSMRFFDQIELFEFDNMPYSFKEVLIKNGKDWVKKELKGIIKSELEFDNVAFAASLSFAGNCEDIFYKIKLSNFVILLKNIDSSMQINPKDTYNLAESGEIESLQNIVQKECADIIIDVNKKNSDQVIAEVLEEIKKYYNVN